MSDLDRVMELDSLSFPNDGGVSVPAAAGELEQGISTGQMLVARSALGDEALGYLQFHRQSAGRFFYIAGIGVDPNHRRKGIAREMLSEFLRQHVAGRDHEYGVCVVVRPDNIPMLRLLFSMSFVATAMVNSFFGEGQDRLYLTLTMQSNLLTTQERLLVPITCPGPAFEMLKDRQYVIGDIVDLPHVSAFEVRHLMAADEPALMANETSVSVSFSGVLLGVITFILGFGLVATGIPGSLLLQLMIGLVANIVALVAYANATGDLARVRRGHFARLMEIGNVLSEFFGVILVLQVVPVVLASLRRTESVGLVACICASIALLGYEASGMDILGRFTSRRFKVGLVDIPIICSPIVGYLVIGYPTGLFWWSICNLTILGAISIWCLFKAGEVGDPLQRIIESKRKRSQ